MQTTLPTRPPPPPQPPGSSQDPPRTDETANGRSDADDRDAARRRRRHAQAHQLSADAISVSDRILSEVARLLELDAAANADAPNQHSPRAAQPPRILLANLTRQLRRERAGAERYLAEFVAAADGDDGDGDELEGDLAFTRLSCLNITFYETLWEVVKGKRGLVSALREIEVPSPSPCASRKGARRNMAKVDAMVENGAEWIKIITADERRLVYQMASAGWDWEIEDGAEPGLDLRDDDDDESGIDAIDAVRDLVAAAAASRVGPYHYQTPSVRAIFPRITEGESIHVDSLIAIIRTLGEKPGVSLSVECGPPPAAPPAPADSAPPSLDETLLRLVPRDDFFFSPSLNLDCTILFNLGSDTAHLAAQSFDSRSEARIREDLDDERRNGPRLPRSVYPSLGGRELVCTDEVAANFRGTVLDIGTETEVARAALLLPPAGAPVPTPPPSEAERRRVLAAFQELSVHPVPPDLRLPIRVVETPSPEEVRGLVAGGAVPPVLLGLEERMKSMNASAMVQGWAREQTTLTSNRQGMNLMNQILLEAGDEGARAGNVLHVWMVPFGRRLAAKPREGVRVAAEPVKSGDGR